MDKLITVVYYTEEDGTPRSVIFDDEDPVGKGLAKCQELRNQGYRFVVSSTENPNWVGAGPGVSTVGADYNWKKRRI